MADYKQILATASKHLLQLTGHNLDVLTIAKPLDLPYTIHLSRIISKLSPMLGNTIEYKIVALLNELENWPEGKWLRQDPGFPDVIFHGSVEPAPGIEIKTWFPLATEITGRFKESVTHFQHDQTNVAMVAWLPDGIIFGKPKIIDVWIDSARSVAEARDRHYHDPPDYLVFEPEDTTARTRNLQQTNTNGFKFQGSPDEFTKALAIVKKWGRTGKTFSHSSAYQAKIKGLLGQFNYRADTNFAKMDRIQHTSLEQFKTRVLNSIINGRSVREWQRILANPVTQVNANALKELVGL